METKGDNKLGKSCNLTPDGEEEQQTDANSKQGDEQNKQNDHKLHDDVKRIIRLSLIVAAIIVLSIILTPTNYNKKVAKAVKKYEAQNTAVLSTSRIDESTKYNHYIIFERNGTIFYDGLDKGVPVKAIMPREEGFVFKQIIPVFKDRKPTLTYKLLNNGQRSNLSLGYGVSNKITEAKKNVLNGDKAICIEERLGFDVITSYYYSMSNPDTVYVFRGELTLMEDESYSEQGFSFLEVTEKEEDDWWAPFSYSDYRFTMRIVFPNSDPQKLGFDNRIYIVNEEDYPMDLIWDRLQYTKKEGTQPIVWYNEKNMDVVVDCLEKDMSRKYDERISQQRAEEIEQNTYTLEQLCNIYSQSSSKFGGESFDEMFPIGRELYLITRAESIDYSRASGYKYVITATKGLGLEVEANIYTNDDGFVDLNYPVSIGVKASFGGTYTEKKSLLVPRMRIFDFYDAELLGWENK